MSVIHRIGIHFSIRTERKDKAGNAPIYMLLTHQSEKISLSTNQKVPVKKWNAIQQKVSGTDASAKSINNQIDILRAKVIESVNTLTLQQKFVSLEAIKSMIAASNGNTTKKTLLNAAQIHNEEIKALLGTKYGYKTYQYYLTTEGFLKQFLQQDYNRNDIYLEEMEFSFAKNFEKWVLLNTKSNHNGMMKHIQRLKKIINWSIANGWLNNSPLTGFKISFNKFDRGYLSLEEIALIEEATLIVKHLNIARDLFLFQIYTGLAHADLYTLSWKHIHLNHQGNDWIIKPREKTDILTTVPLLPQAKKILAKRIQGEPNDKVFYVYTNQPYNRYLKELAGEIGVKKRLTSHLARHTFATTITLSKGIPIETVSRMLGHTKISTTQIYSKVTTGKIASDMDKLMNFDM